MIWAWLIKLYHAAHAPHEPRWSDVVPFHSSFLMDDQVLVEPAVGTRAFQSMQVAEEGVGLLLGGEALNREKDEEEGKMETQKICWGLLYDTERELVAMPRPKIEKAAFLLADPELDAGNVNICHKFLEQYRGNQQYWSLVVPPLRTLTSATDALMKGGRQGGRTRPPGGDRHRQLIFEDFWRATEMARILLADEEQWEASFVGAFSGVLSLNERLALPGRQCKLIWVTGDATLERVATVDWTRKRAAA